MYAGTLFYEKKMRRIYGWKADVVKRGGDLYFEKLVQTSIT